MSMGLLNLFFAGAILSVILFAGVFPFKKRIHCEGHHHGAEFPVGETLATGVFLGAALLHMLPESNTLFQASHLHFPWAYLITGITFLLFLWFEHLGKELYHQEGTHPAFAIVAWLMLSIHSLVVGTALGLSNDYATQIMIFLAIITHKWAESFAIAVQLNKSSLTTKNSMMLFLLFAAMTPSGVWIGWVFKANVSTYTLVDPVLMAISAGTFLYLGTLHGLERCVMVERCCNLSDFSFVIVGFLLMAAVAHFL